MRIEELLPIGSIVLLKDAEKKLMIHGVKQTNQETEEEYDYSGVLYPEGDIGEIGKILFNHDQIEHVYFEGYVDEEREKFIQKLNDFYQDHV
jgi:hypothetical protein